MATQRETVGSPERPSCRLRPPLYRPGHEDASDDPVAPGEEEEQLARVVPLGGDGAVDVMVEGELGEVGTAVGGSASPGAQEVVEARSHSTSASLSAGSIRSLPRYVVL